MTKAEVVAELVRRRDQVARQIRLRKDFWGKGYSWAFGEEVHTKARELDFYDSALQFLDEFSPRGVCTRDKGHDGPCNGWPCYE